MLAPITPTAKKANALAASPSFTPSGGVSPVVGGRAVGDQEDPGAIEGDAVCAVGLLPQAHELDAAW